MFVASDDYKSVQQMKEIIEQDMTREPVQLGEITADQLKERAVCYVCRRDATRALALMSFDPQDLTGDTDGLSESELDVLEDWELKFIEKYPKVGVLVGDRTSDQQKQEEVVEEDAEKTIETKKAV
ncbi:Membrane steroid-binding protein 1 [Bienertia sinuspersici]